MIGKVQGVWFRKGTQLEATSLGLYGDVRNLHDGSVLINVSGPKLQVDKLLEWCKSGTPNAKVESISFQEIEMDSGKGFEIIR